ncbi:unnamed protein product [Rhizophagus irregularis]|uniref:SHSP domain-containing protein n=2 Tax=Rhizophagus irregularis TaxID=588596 RepID=A0A915Z2B7_9GLOM|nr:unnamed protein product [Rhizophagus irregularis]
MKLRIYSQCRIASMNWVKIKLTLLSSPKKDQKFQEGKTLVQERRYGNFSSNISLSPNIKAEEVTAKFENGILEMRFPKSAFSCKKIDVI